ncbi:hypothetical protein Hanom_Chr07g00674831 [Helianthus anomalus]
METGVACFARGTILPSVASQHSTSSYASSTRSTSSSFTTTRVCIYVCMYASLSLFLST